MRRDPAELEPDEVQRLLSRPARTVSGQVGRRAFLQGAVASAGAAALLPSLLGGSAGAAPAAAPGSAAAPVGPADGILVLIQCGGGNDGLNTLCPTGDPAYRSARPSLAVPTTAALGIAPGFGLHPSLPKLKVRYDAGKVAVVRGVGQVNDDLSHFSSTANWMAGTTTSDRSSGWMGRWLDTLPDGADGLRGVTIGEAIPLHMIGRTSVVTGMGTDGGGLYGSDNDQPWKQSTFDAVSAFGAGATGKGRWGDSIAQTERSAIGLSTRLAPLYLPALQDGDLVPQLQLAARLINADLGIRVVNASFGSFDTHDAEATPHAQLLTELDDAIALFYATLDPQLADQVTLMTFSEFGRRVAQNDSGGTDHGRASVLFVVGDQVKGGLLGAQPSLTDLDSRGDLRVQVDFRSVYASVLSGWLGTAATPILGGTFDQLDLFARGPGEPVTPPPPIPSPWTPFATVTALVQQQYLDFLGRPADAAGTSYWTGLLTSHVRTIPAVVKGFLDSREFGRSVSPAARLALACFAAPPAFDDLLAWGALVRAGTALPVIAAQVCTRPAFVNRYATTTDAAFVSRAYRDLLGGAVPATFAATWQPRLDGHSATRADVMAALSELPANVARALPQVDVLMTYAGMLRRAPDAGGFAYWVSKVRAGTSLQVLIGQFFASTEYRNRFAG